MDSFMVDIRKAGFFRQKLEIETVEKKMVTLRIHVGNY